VTGSNLTTSVPGRVVGRARSWRLGVAGRDVLLAFAVSRVLSDGLILVMARAAGHRITAGGFARWDGHWYLRIARSGYPSTLVAGRQSRWAFFPLLPALMHALHWVGIPLTLAGLLLNHLAFALALAGLYQLASRNRSRSAARLCCWSLALFPASTVFSMLYPSALFLAASVWAFLAVEGDRDILASLAALAATMARPNGIVVAIALAFAVGFRWRRVVHVCGPPVAAFGGWMLYNLVRTGDALAFYRVKKQWMEVTILRVFDISHSTVLVHVVLAGAALLAVVLAWRQLRTSWVVFTACYLLPSLGFGVLGMGRYANESFPPFIAAGIILDRRGRVVRAAAFALAIAGQVFFAYWTIRRKHYP
jgi:hypothetical protein